MTRTKRPLYRDPAMWVVVGLPVATLIAGAWTLQLAAGSSATDAAPEQVRRTAQVQLSNLDADSAAAKLALTATLHQDEHGIRVVGNGITNTPVLQLDFIHPIESSLDKQVLLHAEGENIWRGAPGPNPGIAWHLRLSPVDGSWRLVARQAPGQAEVPLQPAITAQ